MIKKVKADIRDRIGKIAGGSYSADDVRLLFIDLRDSIPDDTDRSALKIDQLCDIFNFAAHPNSRERGKTFRVSKKIISQFVTAITKGGSVEVSLLDLDVTTSIATILDLLGIEFDAAKLAAQETTLKANVYRLIDEVEISVEDQAIEYARIHHNASGGMTFIEFKMKPFDNKIGNMTIMGAPTMRFRLY